ncbi:YoaK family protein [Variovorax sp. J22P168]|uniref:YoaK family protein n=1 Tax=Variovorax jilinensis TaxID=3053513 RepID=UPI0025787EF7|nr:YoaK family protein [Variovorax sp. J22P168]MDM0014972.1 YoaK family protein [Variovorax sp. J22P168]
MTRASLVLAVCLAALAGYIDAIGFLYLGGYFVSFMSGNTTRLAVALQAGDAIGILLGIIACFVAGAGCGTLVGHFAGARRRAAVLVSVAATLALAAALVDGHGAVPSILLMAFAMGMENTVFQRDGTVVVGLTYMTGTLVKMGQKLALAMLGQERLSWFSPLVLWIGLLSGGVLGASTYGLVGLRSLWLGVLAALILAACSLKISGNEVGSHA